MKKNIIVFLLAIVTITLGVIIVKKDSKIAELETRIQKNTNELELSKDSIKTLKKEIGRLTEISKLQQARILGSKNDTEVVKIGN